MTTREERSRWLTTLLRMALAEDRRKLELHTVIERAVEYGASAVPRTTVSEFADLLLAREFDVSDPDYQMWADAINWHLRYCDPESPGEVISVMQEMGFVIIPPKRKDFAVFYNGVMIADFGSATLARQFLGGAADKAGYQIRDRAGQPVQP